MENKHNKKPKEEEIIFLNKIKSILEKEKLSVKISSDYKKIWINTIKKNNNNIQIELSYNGLFHLGTL